MALEGGYPVIWFQSTGSDAHAVVIYEIFYFPDVSLVNYFDPELGENSTYFCDFQYIQSY